MAFAERSWPGAQADYHFEQHPQRRAQRNEDMVEFKENVHEDPSLAIAFLTCLPATKRLRSCTNSSDWTNAQDRRHLYTKPPRP